MSNETKNLEDLKAAALAATPGRVGDRIDGSGSIKYECVGYDGSVVLRTDHKNMEYGFVGDNSDADELFFRMCVPDVILSALAELEGAQQRIAELEQELHNAITRGDGTKDQLKAAEKRIAELEEVKVSEGEVWMVHGVGLPLYVTEEKEYITRRKKRDAELLFTKSIVDELRQRIAELEEAEQKLCAANATLDALTDVEGDNE